MRRVVRFANALREVVTETIGRRHDHVQLTGQYNWRRYVPIRQLRIRLLGGESFNDIALSFLAAAAAGCQVTYSCHGAMADAMSLLDSVCDHVLDNARTPWRCEWIEESDQALAAEICDSRVDRLRLLGPTKNLAASVHEACHDAFITVIAEPVVQDAEIEVLRYLNEQSISHDYHRYGNLGRRLEQNTDK